MKLPSLAAVGRRIKQRLAEALNVVSSGVGGSGGWFNIVREGFGGAWQQGMMIDSQKDILAFSAVFSCVTGIASDFAKLRLMQMKKEASGIGVEVDPSADDFMKVLRRPNHYQNRIQFWLHYIISKLLYGNVYVLKARGKQNKVEEMYVLDPQRVTVLVAESGDVYYRLARDDLSGLRDAVVVPASEIIHDLMNPLWHPLIGVSPIYACALSATMGNYIQKNSSKFFNNMSRPSGALTAPGVIDDVTANRMKEDWEKNFGGNNIGRLAVLGDGLKYEAMTIPAQEAQLIEQLKWTVEDVARCFHYPMYKLGGTIPGGTSIQSLNQEYYNACLQLHIESAELCLDEALPMPPGTYSEFDVENLMRMDTAARYEANEKGVGGGWLKPNEARRKEGLSPVEGGDACYLQQQNFSLEALAKRDAKENPFESAERRVPQLPAPPSNARSDEDDMAEIASTFVRMLEEVEA